METSIMAIVVTPVKDSLASTLDAIAAIGEQGRSVKHIVYDDFSSAETKKGLTAFKDSYDYTLIHLEELTEHPSPNYRLVLQDAQRRALQENLPLIIVESDVVVRPDTFDKMLAFYASRPDVGLLGAVTVDDSDRVNFPYLRLKEQLDESASPILETKKSLSFCCTLISLAFLKRYDFERLDDSKHWFDTTISYAATDLGFRNYLMKEVPVLHKPHGSRPWKLLKYSNPLKYYFLKFINRRDKI